MLPSALAFRNNIFLNETADVNLTTTSGLVSILVGWDDKHILIYIKELQNYNRLDWWGVLYCCEAVLGKTSVQPDRYFIF